MRGDNYLPGGTGLQYLSGINEPITVEEELLSLPECEARLRAALGPRAPTLITLKRWSAGGRLNVAKVSDERGRPRYRYVDVEGVARERAQQSTATRAREERLKAAAKAGGQDRVLIVDRRDLEALSNLFTVELEKLGGQLVDQIRSGIAEKVLTDVVREAVASATAALGKDLAAAIASVEAIRRSLMLKYDAETAMLRGRIDELKAENERLKRDAAGALDAQRVSAQLNKIIDKLGEIQNPPT